MIIGILSDSHGRVKNAQMGLDKLRTEGAEFYFHCGDVGAETTLDQFAGLKTALVWGNTDWERGHLTRYAENLGILVFDPWGSVELAGKRFAMTHGDKPLVVREILERQQHDYLLVGHSHIRADERVGRTRVINPGALYRAATLTVAVLDTETDALRFLDV